MSITNESKLNQLLQKVPSGALFLSSWMKQNNIPYSLQHRYINSMWLTPVASGVMVRTGEKPTLNGAIYSLNTQLKKNISIGAMSALDLLGYSHYVPMGKKNIELFLPSGERLPSWFKKYDWSVNLRHFTTECFGAKTSIDTIKQGVFDILISSPERAFMECLYLAPQYYNLTDLYYVMELLSILQPTKVQQLLEVCSSVKVKRLFLYMAEKTRHSWFSELDLTKISLGSGKREIVKGGVYDNKYRITIPVDLKNYD